MGIIVARHALCPQIHRLAFLGTSEGRSCIRISSEGIQGALTWGRESYPPPFLWGCQLRSASCPQRRWQGETGFIAPPECFSPPASPVEGTQRENWAQSPLAEAGQKRFLLREKRQTLLGGEQREGDRPWKGLLEGGSTFPRWAYESNRHRRDPSPLERQADPVALGAEGSAFTSPGMGGGSTHTTVPLASSG